MNRETQLKKLVVELNNLGVDLTNWTPFVEKYGVFGFQNGDRHVIIINPTTRRPNANHPLWGNRGWWVSVPGQPLGEALRMPPWAAISRHEGPLRGTGAWHEVLTCGSLYFGRGWVRRMAWDMAKLNAFAS